MNVHEYQAKAILSEFGVPVSRGVAILDAAGARDAIAAWCSRSGWARATTSRCSLRSWRKADTRSRRGAPFSGCGSALLDPVARTASIPGVELRQLRHFE